MLAKEKITKIVEKWYLLEPLYFAVWTLHKVEPSVHIKTIKVYDGHIKFNPIFIDNLSAKELNEVLAFEAMRIILKHPYRRKKIISQISYQASNITVQEYIKTTSLGFQYAKDYFGSNEYDKKHFEFYYDKIIEQEQEKQEKQNEQDKENIEKNENNDDRKDTEKNEKENNDDRKDTEKNEKENNDDRKDTEKNENENNNDRKNTEKNEKENNNDGKNTGNKTGNNEKENENNTTDSQSDDNDNSNQKNSKNDLNNNDRKNTRKNKQKNTDDKKNDTENNNSDTSNNSKKNKKNYPKNYPKNNLSEYTDKKQTGYENANDWDKNEYEEQMINDKIKEIQMSNSWGTITGNVQEQILATLKPKVNYRTILKAFRASVLSNKRRLTRMKPSRRYGFLYMGSRRDFNTKLLFAVDISGSVSSKALKNAFSILNRFFKYGIKEISAICFDTEIKGKLLTLKKAKKEIKIYGRGGTDFNAVVDYINKNREYDGVIIFTDGYAPPPDIPKNRKTKILWLFDSEENYNYCKDDLYRFGKVAFVKES